MLPGGYRVVVRDHLRDGEEVLFVERGGVMSAAVDPRSKRTVAIHEFGTDRGWLGATSTGRVIYGYVRPILGGAKVAGSFSFTGWRKDERGIAFLNEGLGPEDLCVFTPRTVEVAELHGHMKSGFGDQPEDQTEESSSSSAPPNPHLRTHYHENHDWHNPTVWKGVPNWRVFTCSICGIVTQQPALDSDIGVVPITVLRPSPVGMDFKTLVRDDLAKVAEVLEGSWSFATGVIELDLAGTITGTVTVAEGQYAHVTGAVGRLVLDGGRAVVWRGGEVLGDVVFMDGELEIYEGKVHGALRTDAVSSLDDFQEGAVSHDWLPNGFYGLPRIRIRHEAELVGGFRPLER